MLDPVWTLVMGLDVAVGVEAELDIEMPVVIDEILEL